jgi:FixJ family two-component response regulator
MKPTENAQTHSTVFVVDDDPSVRKGLVRLLKSAGYVVESFASAREFLDRIGRGESAGCVVLDVRMPGLSGLELQRELRAFTPPIPIIFLTGHGDIPMSVRAMKDGATDFLAKPVHDEDLLVAVQQALARNVEDRVRYEVIRELQQRASTLTPRELEVMALVVRGRLNKQAAGELGTVEKTIKVHRARVMEKMKVTSLADLVLAAEKLGILPGAMMPLVFLPPDATPPGGRASPPSA